jgi:hypothetical protein
VQASSRRANAFLRLRRRPSNCAHIELGPIVPRTEYVLALQQVEYQRHRIIGRHIAEHRISQLAHRIEGFHEHVGVGDLARQEMCECLLSTIVVALLMSAS